MYSCCSKNIYHGRHQPASTASRRAGGGLTLSPSLSPEGRGEGRGGSGAVADPVDAPGALVGEVEGAVGTHREVDGAAVDAPVVEPARREVLHGAGRAVLERHSDHLV